MTTSDPATSPTTGTPGIAYFLAPTVAASAYRLAFDSNPPRQAPPAPQPATAEPTTTPTKALYDDGSYLLAVVKLAIGVR